VSDVTLIISPRRCATALAAAVLVVTTASTGASLLSFMPIGEPGLSHLRDSLVRLTWVDAEANVPAWFSAGLLLCCAFLLALIAAGHKQCGGRVIPWTLLSAVFVLLSLDEVAQLHELSIRPLREHFHTTGFLYYPWIVPAGLCVSSLALGYSGFLTSLPGRTRWLFLGAGAVYLAGALGLEAVSGEMATRFGEWSPAYHGVTMLEELLEMTGLVAFMYALLDYIGRRFSRIALQAQR
jgi:hypothetical protein